MLQVFHKRVCIVGGVLVWVRSRSDVGYHNVGRSQYYSREMGLTGPDAPQGCILQGLLQSADKCPDRDDGGDSRSGRVYIIVERRANR